MMNWLSALLIFGAGPDAISGWEQILYLIPLVLCSSLVYGATRHEDWTIIAKESVKLAAWLLCFTGGVFVAVLLFSFFN